MNWWCRKRKVISARWLVSRIRSSRVKIRSRSSPRWVSVGLVFAAFLESSRISFAKEARRRARRAG